MTDGPGEAAAAPGRRTLLTQTRSQLPRPSFSSSSSSLSLSLSLDIYPLCLPHLFSPSILGQFFVIIAHEGLPEYK